MPSWALLPKTLIGLRSSRIPPSVEEGFLRMVQNLESQVFVIFQKHPSSLTVRARHPSNKEVADFVLARKETYGPESRTPIVSLGTLFDDQKRRDYGP